MAKAERLFQRDNGRWTFRVAVPEQLREAVGKKEIWKSFGLVSFAEAKKLARLESIKVDAVFAAAASHQEGEPSPYLSLTDQQILFIAQNYLYDLEANVEVIPFDERARVERLEAAQENAFDVGQTIEDAGLQRVASNAARLAGQPSLSPTDLIRVTDAVQRALLEHYARDGDRASLRPEGRYDQAFAEVDSKTPPVSPLTVRQAIEQYKADPERANVAPRTRGAYEFRYRLLEELLGPDKPVGTVTRADVREVRDLLLTLPPNAIKIYPGKSLREIALIAQQEKVAPMSAKSAVLYVEAISALFNWLSREEMVARNPAAALKGPALDEETDRRPYTIEELNTLFTAPAFNGDCGRGWLYWMPRLALYTGARFAELLALRVVDLIQEEGVTCISITPYGGRKLKTKGSKRLVPIHPVLIQAGFLKHVSEQPSDGLIFPDAVGPKHMIAAQNKKMGREIRAIFRDEALVFHGLRHTFKDGAGRARIRRELVSMIGGWKIGDGHAAMDSYGRDRLLPVLFEEISKIEFSGVKIAS
jgi:integrase